MSDFIPIEDIESQEDPSGEGVVPHALTDDPHIGDGSAGREGVGIASWRLHTLRKDKLVGMTEYEGNDRRSRKARRAQQAAREVRTEEERNARKRKRVIVGFVLVAILATTGAIGSTYALELWGGRSVPNVEGLPQTHAIELMEERGFTVSVETTPSDYLEGRVVAFSPEAGTRLETGSAVSLTIGESRVLPDVVGMSQKEARSVLKEAGATNVRTQPLVTLDEEEDIVREVRPGAGSVFISTDEITLVVTQLPRVPDVTDATEERAKKTLEEAALPYHVDYERGSAEQRRRVIRVEPAVGERVEVGEEVHVVVGDALINPLRLQDYFDASMPQIRPFLEGEGYGLKAAAKEENTHVVARFENDRDAQISLLDRPWSHEADKANGVAEVFGDDAKLEGVRLQVNVNREPTQTQEQQDSQGEQQTQPTEGETTETRSKGLELLGLEKAPVDESTARAVADACGFGQILGQCTHETITLPPGVSRAGHTVFCCYGETDQLIWTVLVVGTADHNAEATRIVATCSPKSYFTSLDLTTNGNKICDFVAYVDEYA